MPIQTSPTITAQAASPADVLRTVRQRVSRVWTSGRATDVLLSLRSEHCTTACILFTRANGVRIALFEGAYPSHAGMLAALDAAILLAEREAVS